MIDQFRKIPYALEVMGKGEWVKMDAFAAWIFGVNKDRELVIRQKALLVIGEPLAPGFILRRLSAADDN